MNMSEIHNFLLHMSEDERTLLFQMPFGQKVLMAFVISMSIIWGSLMKLFIYYNIGQDKWKERPINILIIIDQVIQHFFNTVIGIGMVVKVTF
jgi:hypothetical protein